MLPRFIRQSGIGAKGRVARIYTAKGSAGMFAEIALIEGSWAKRVYYSHLLEQPGITPRDVQQALAQAGREIDSDFELASLLISADHLVKDDATRKAYFDAAGTIGSDFEMRRVFSSALKNGPVAPSLLAGVLDASIAIDSDFEEASLLVQVAALQPIDATTRAAFFRALDTVDSAFERARVLKGLMNAAICRRGAGERARERCAGLLGLRMRVGAAGVREGSSDRRSGAAGVLHRRERDRSAFERGRVLQSVARRSDVSDETILGVIKSASTISSSHEKAQVLLTLASTHELTREGRDAYIDASGQPRRLRAGPRAVGAGEERAAPVATDSPRPTCYVIEVLAAVGVNLPVHVPLGVVDDVVNVLIDQGPLIGQDRASVLTVAPAAT